MLTIALFPESVDSEHPVRNTKNARIKIDNKIFMIFLQ